MDDVYLSRRSLLAGAAALGAVAAVGGLAACSDDGDDDRTADTGDDGDDERSLVLMADSASSVVVGEPARLPLGAGDRDGILLTDAPDALTIRVEDTDGNEVAPAVEVPRRDAGLPRAYYPLTFTAPAAGFYLAKTEVDGKAVEAAFQVGEPDTIVIPVPGQPFPATPTPTTADAGGVDPICTNDPVCPLHEADLESVLGTAPVAVLVSTPAFCQTAICGPVLDLFVAAGDAHPDVTFIHVEVYESAAAVEEAGPQAALAPAVQAWRLPYEPALFLVAADGTLADRLDVIFDADELDEALTRLTA